MFQVLPTRKNKVPTSINRKLKIFQLENSYSPKIGQKKVKKSWPLGGAKNDANFANEDAKQFSNHKTSAS